ncbi:hypothetical protein EWM64_g3682 [Hericium alpestre]|uniref:Uncharacterized protein n=1 Tax=Hericium alpestre TaxID=135208 RepID=A0A4Z0A1X2_9AGAM|nr:hypothetical protein EWM64_g3682 [Hericium alpestre]
MKFFAAVFALASFAAVSAQNIAIGAPADGTSVSPRSTITVQVLRPNSLTGSQEVAVAISILGCQSYPAGCPDPTQVLGTTLYSGGFNPQYPPAGTQRREGAAERDAPLARGGGALADDGGQERHAER